MEKELKQSFDEQLKTKMAQCEKELIALYKQRIEEVGPRRGTGRPRGWPVEGPLTDSMQGGGVDVVAPGGGSAVDGQAEGVVREEAAEPGGGVPGTAGGAAQQVPVSVPGGHRDAKGEGRYGEGTAGPMMILLCVSVMADLRIMLTAG